MHRCSSNSNMVGQCSCGLFHHTSQSNSFSMLFSMPCSSNNNKPFDDFGDMSSCPFMSNSSAVDCTLSLGTPSTRLSNDNNGKGVVQHERRSSSSSSYMPNFCWDLLQPKQVMTSHGSHKTNGRPTNTNTSAAATADPLLARRCANCDTTSTPLWRNGPRGPKSLCNACGIRFKKEERRASAAAATTTTTTSGGAAGVAGIVESQHMMNGTNSWLHHQHQSYSHSTHQKIQCLAPTSFGNEFRFMDDDDRDSETGIPFLSWRLNVTDSRPSLVHDFTR